MRVVITEMQGCFGFISTVAHRIRILTRTVEYLKAHGHASFDIVWMNTSDAPVFS